MESTTLTESLNARQNEYRYLLLDPLKSVMPWNSLHLDRLYELWGEDALRRVPRPDLVWSPEHCPLLLLLASPGESYDEEEKEEIVPWSEEYSRGEAWHDKRYVCGWLSGGLAPDAMAEWLAELCQSVKPGADIPLFEPLRLELLQATTDPELLSALLAPVSQWQLISCAGELKTLTGSNGDDKWQLNWKAEEAQTEAPQIWRLLSDWREASGGLPADAARRAAEAWSETAAAGLHHLSDRLWLGLNTLTLTVDITRHPAIQALLQQAASDPEQHLTSLLRTLPETVWQELSQEIAAEKGTE